MSAKEMFEKLGYKQLVSFKPNDKYIVIAWDMEKHGEEFTIYFYGSKEIRIVMETKRGEICPPLFSLEELQAINKQIEELGWLDER
jgi:hypothetical protein